MPRPSFPPTLEKRKLVRSLAALGIRQAQLCEVVGVRSPKTLRKHFAEELQAGSAEAMGRLTRVAYEMAASGKYPVMTIFWLKVHQGQPEDPMVDGDWDPSRIVGAELLFQRLEPMPEEEASGYEQLARNGRYYVYRHRSDARKGRRSGRPGHANRGGSGEAGDAED